MDTYTPYEELCDAFKNRQLLEVRRLDGDEESAIADLCVTGGVVVAFDDHDEILTIEEFNTNYEVIDLINE